MGRELVQPQQHSHRGGDQDELRRKLQGTCEFYRCMPLSKLLRDIVSLDLCSHYKQTLIHLNINANHVNIEVSNYKYS